MFRRICDSLLTLWFLLFATSCATPHGIRSLRGPASDESANFDPIDSQCYREFFRREKRAYSLPWGPEGPITIPLGDAWTEVRRGSEGASSGSTAASEAWSRQPALRYGIIDGAQFLQLELIPYDRAAFGRACRGSDAWAAVNPIEFNGHRYLVLEGTIDFAAIYDPVSGVPIGEKGSSLLGKPYDRCLFDETQRQNLEYLSWESALRGRGVHLVPIDTDARGTFLKARPMPEELREKALADLRKNMAEAAQRVYREYNSRVRQAKESNTDKAMVAPSAEDLLSNLDIDSCLASPFFAPILDTIRTRVLACQDVYSDRKLDCSQ